MKERILRNKWSIGIGILVFIVCILILKINPSKLADYSGFLSNSISFSSLTTAVFMATFVFIPLLDIGLLKEMSTNKKFTERILIVITLFFSVSILSLLMSILIKESSTTILASILLSLLISILSSAIAESIEILKIVFILNWNKKGTS
ncbi:hypothetical protein [Periweissella ghanensis]|uniref:Uncharacterized protein n=1 Tax=Periweissella ghanensis TaxID=467997 RepID=A0ABN8BT50_9LACO|nr:hypothetical protein [Periweissella ghanensis]MCM0601311.1 hypothetical protein [Periweissella ghanensis]CAH0419402.1 hypothetical protein WGH24286_01852 [Periweissella ghanensis]